LIDSTKHPIADDLVKANVESALPPSFRDLMPAI